MLIRPTIESDISQITKIYAHYVLNTIANFEEVPPTINEMKNRWQSVQQKGLPYLTAYKDEQVVGFCYAGEYRRRSGYKYTIEDSVYISQDYLQQGIGKALLSELISKCNDYKQMIAVICGDENGTSAKLHKSLGFKKIGVLQNVGFKFNEWIDTILMQKNL